MQTKYIIGRGRLRTIEDALETWQSSWPDAIEVPTLADIVIECVDLADFLCKWERAAWGLLDANRLPNVQRTGQHLREALHQALQLLEEVGKSLQWAADQGHKAGNPSLLDDAVKRVQESAAKLEQRWPFIDPRQVEQARAALARGEFQTGEDILRELQSPDRQARTG